jgi:murein DD-endopeptidase MepM/ murein hydrolase activator NlpD
MKRKVRSSMLSARNLILILGILIVGLQLPQDSMSVSQAQAQTAPRPGSMIAATTSLPADEVQPLSKQATTPSVAIPPSVFAPDSYFRTLDPSPVSPVLSSTLGFPEDTDPRDSGGGEYRLPDVPDVTDQQRQEIQTLAYQNAKLLGLQGPTDIAPFSAALSWPIRAANGLADYGYHGVSAFVDHNAANPGQLQDYNCGTRTYDLTGYDHKGTDIFTWPFGWKKMDNNEVEVIAAAPGTIVLKQDGSFDRSCGFNTNPWNGVIIQHADGSQAWYVHMKGSSVTAKSVGATVARGEYLGIVGSSGSSTGPHLHFELHDAGNDVIDPFAGACNNISSWWTAQRPYYDSAVNALMTGGAAPVFPACPEPEISNAKNQFNPGDTIYFSTYYRDQLLGQPSQYTVYQPDGTAYRSWTHTSPVSYYAASYWYRSYTLGANVPSGVWEFEVVFDGHIYVRNFAVGYAVSLRGRPADRTIYLDWEVFSGLPVTSTWRIAYAGLQGAQASPITGLGSPTRAYTLTGLTNYTWYTVTLSAVVNAMPIMSDTMRVMPTDRFVYLPLLSK